MYAFRVFISDLLFLCAMFPVLQKVLMKMSLSCIKQNEDI